MNLVWNNYIKFLQDNNINIEYYNIKEGYYWIDRNIIKAYDKTGVIHKIIRLDIDDQLNISIKNIYNNKYYDIESWEETIVRKSKELKSLEDESISIIRDKLKQYNDFSKVILTSGGKDSVLVDYLVSKCIENPNRIFNNTSLECSDTYKYIKSLNNVKIINPKEGFYQWRKRLDFIPSKISRACCSVFKEGETVNQLDSKENILFFMGMRNDESNKRSNYGYEWVNEKWKNRNWIGILPIRKWSEENVWLYILKNKLDINEKYKKGYDRVGCTIVCPYQNKFKWALDKYWYPSMYNRWHQILDEDFVKNNRDINMNCTQREYHFCWNGGRYRSKPTEQVINEFAERNGLDINIAKKYFNHKCDICGKNILDKSVIGMNMKFFGRQIERFKCKKCIMKEFGWTKEDWDTKVNEFKEQSCKLF